jgi:OmpA-OmpF porin, OOP family
MTQSNLIHRRVLFATAVLSPLVALAQDPTSDANVRTQTTTAAQTPAVIDPNTTMNGDTRYSWIPFTTHGYVGASVGESKFDIDCASGFSCDRKTTGFKIFTGGRFHDIIGLELSILELGKSDRAGGSTRARGANLSVIGNLPLNDRVSLFGRVGGTYGWTKTESNSSAIASGKDHGFGLGYGAGLNFNLSTNWGLRAEWERHRFQFVNEKSDIDLYSVGFNYKF